MSDNEQYEVLEKIGHGSFGVIRKVRRKSDGHVLCRKEINYVRMSQKEREQLHSEFSILNSLRHPNIVAYFHREHLKSTQDLHLYMEYCGNGDLGRVIKNLKAKNQFAEEEFVWSIFTQLVTALYRCHYGIDPPEVGRNVMGVGLDAKRKIVGGKAQVMILHRDLKPENVFLGEDNSVKLGDFGLSKIMQSHDFASTYVGTPFYMSPEICAAERYTLHSDIWSLGCIMYELCAREPPFNAKTHFHLVQKIKEGKVAPLPNVYSPELQSVIKSCLKVNPTLRPDTATLLNLPVVKLMRKEREVVDLGRILKSKEELAALKVKEMEERAMRLELEREVMRRELDAIIRREWEVKARLEIDRQVKIELEQIEKRVEIEVQERVRTEVQRQLRILPKPKDEPSITATTASTNDDIPLSSVSTTEEMDFPSTTDLTELSLASPSAQPSKASKKTSRTPFSRSRTLCDGSPMDVQMVDPSPMSIASLSLSPRRNMAGNGRSKNIFAAAAVALEPRAVHALVEITDDEDDDDLPPLPSPTRQKSTSNPFKPARPALLTQKTAPMQRLQSQPNLFGPSATNKGPSQSHVPSLPPQPETAAPAQPEKMSTSPTRRLSKIPSSTGLTNDNGSPMRKAKTQTKPAFVVPATDDMFKAVTKNNMMKGRTLVELAQARAGGRPTHGANDDHHEQRHQAHDSGISMPVHDSSGKKPSMKKRQTIGEAGSVGVGVDVSVNLASTRIGNAAGAAVAAKMAAEQVVWDPERDEMPSPFLVRGGGRLAGL
ncbi:MAG: G2-specific serine/threonine protein kinase [Thelocarpon superellum]|nr:MAG: G2-specific serine/threonine protein kinase [Thelocarpon superellum]